MTLVALLLSLCACSSGADPCARTCEGVDCAPVPSTCVLALAGTPPEAPCEGVPAQGTCASALSLLRCVDGQRVEEACAEGSSCGESGGLAGCRAPSCTEGVLRCGASGGLERCGAGAWTAAPCTAGCQGDAVLGTCGEAPARLEGTVRFARRLPAADYSGWGPAELVPGQGLLVASYRGTRLVDLRETDADGHFSLQVASPLPLTDEDQVVVYAAGRSASGAVAYAVADPGLAPDAKERAPGVLGEGPRVWSWSRSARALASGAAFTLGEREGAGAARLFDSLRLAWREGKRRYAGREGLPLVAWLGYGTRWSCGACFAGWSVTAAGRRWEAQAWFSADADEGYWSDAVSLHELGHWLMASYGTVPDEGGPHTLGVPTFPGQAWSEGWATFFSADLRASSRYYDKQDGTMFYVDLAEEGAVTSPRPDAGLLQRLDEAAVSALLLRAARAAGASAPLYSALSAPQMKKSPWGRGYRQHTWRMDPGGAYVDVVQTDVPAPALPDFLDALACAGFSRTALDAATQPTRAYPYPSDKPLCP
ncbi:hypothetical protein FGE12_14500 [Aggregicoccus sp. 17bor-14]|uniref:hypothetical protein n=1 Tax=Myxococcaceae TaxID=31 RepID=UPI00129C68D6|nr:MULTISPECIES: hypothetical protein [Myxococcaceae]MBF5043604.1 hypothetical protein [Simulacricoccus sp. 17bor-14]MRI89363.1 hypothetical protein [Aggregicoccus sp. 17bor-14]